MMRTTIRILAVLAVLQLALVVLSFSATNRLESTPLGTRLLNFDLNAVDSLVIEGPGHSAAKLNQHNGWKTASGFPADDARIEGLLKRLNTMKHGPAVATSSSALARLQLSKKVFQRHLVLKNGEKNIAELYLGKGAGARQSYARSGQANAAYSIQLGSYELSLEDSEWQNKALLQIPVEQITDIKTAGVELQRTPENGDKNKPPKTWQVKPARKNQRLDSRAVQQALELIASLRFSEAFQQFPAGYDKKVRTVVSVRIGYRGKKRSYQLQETSKEKEKQYLLKVSDRQDIFGINSFTAKAWLKKMQADTWFSTATTSTKPAAQKSPTAQ